MSRACHLVTQLPLAISTLSPQYAECGAKRFAIREIHTEEKITFAGFFPLTVGVATEPDQARHAAASPQSGGRRGGDQRRGAL
jgi:hypothetical protein